MVVRRAAISAAVRTKDPGSLPGIARLLEDASGGVRVLAAHALGAFGDRRGVRALVWATRDPKWYVRQAACGSLGALGDPRALPALRRALTDRRPAVAAAAKGAAQRIAATRAPRKS